eukprot:gene5582-biopygen5694
MRAGVVALSSRGFAGRQWIGKDRKIWKYTATRKKNTDKYFSRVATNMALISNPYLSYDQEHGWTKHVGKEEFQYKK